MLVAPEKGGVPDPLIVTALIAEPAFSYFTALRSEHFPPERNYLKAHITLFHKLPGEALADVCDLLSNAVSCTSIGPVEVTKLRFLGQGTAFALENKNLLILRQHLADLLHPLLTPQDKQPWKPHITIQNKVGKEAAVTLFNTLSVAFEPFSLETPGLAVWRYRGGPWEHIADFYFPQN